MIAGHRRRGRMAISGPTATGAGSAAAIYGCPDAGSLVAPGAGGCLDTGVARGKCGSTSTVPGDKLPAPAVGRRPARCRCFHGLVDRHAAPSCIRIDRPSGGGSPATTVHIRHTPIAARASHPSRRHMRKQFAQNIRITKSSDAATTHAYSRGSPHARTPLNARCSPAHTHGDVRRISHDDVRRPSGSSRPSASGMNARGPSAHIRRAAAPRHTKCD